MKVFSTIVKIAVALAAIAGVVYICATYGDRIVAWAKKTLRLDGCCCECDCECTCEDDCDECDEPKECCNPSACEGDFEG